LERVFVELVAAPNLKDTRHDIEVTGSAGAFTLGSESVPSPVNPRTSAITALSVAHTLRHALQTSSPKSDRKENPSPFAICRLGSWQIQEVLWNGAKECDHEFQFLSVG